ncbi:MAG: BON domain-containing protein [Ginsengibacter sp.]
MTKALIAVIFSASILLFSCKPKDASIQTSVNANLAASPECNGATATVEDGIATLTGEVKDDACKSLAATKAVEVKGVKSVVNNLTTSMSGAVTDATMNSGNELAQGVTDATNDFPTVKTSVNNGEITLTGSIKRSDLKTLMQSLNSLHPTKINNKLTIQ